MNETRFDLCVLGAGPAGYAAAMRAHDLGKRVLLVERGRDGAERFVIAPGSRPRTLDGTAFDGRRIVTSDQIESWDRFPESMVIVGAGVVGCEYATMFARFGRTKIHIIDRQPRILPFED